MRARTIALASVAFMAACSEDTTQTLGEADGGRGDVAATADAAEDATADSGVVDRDAGFDDAATPSACTNQLSFRSQLELLASDGTERPLEAFEADATLLRARPLRLALEDGRLDVYEASDRGRPGERLRVRLELYRPFWTEVRLVLLNRASGSLYGAFWDGSSWGTGEFGGTSVRHVDADCRAPVEGCGEREGRTLVVETAGSRTEVPPGTLSELDGAWIINYLSARYVEGPFCTDTPNDWYQGSIWRVPDRDDCGALTRDACIASPDCALHGSLDRDPGYACHPAPQQSAPDCERMDALGCGALSDRCVWDPGECYCPDGAVCACGDGPPPICRRRCRTGDDCADGYFCELAPGAGGLTCTPSSEGGRCVRVPSSCEGAPPGPDVCACPEVTTDGRPVIFDDDCARRRNRAFEVPRTWCDP